jgi:tRNA C32,U32 (ribose-2'-O)-methylase TrmJ
LAEKFLKDAKKSKNNKELFYANLEKAFHNFIKANLKIDSSEMSKENIQNLLRKNNVSETEINKLIGLLNNCDMARYSPAGISKIEEDYDNAVNIMSNLFN